MNMDILVFIFAAIYFVNGNTVRWNCSCQDVIAFVDGHNAIRRKVASGAVRKQPSTHFMYKMVWDEELARKAYDRVANFTIEHNKNNGVPSQRFKTGENIYTANTTETHLFIRPEVSMHAWFQQHKYFKFDFLTKGNFVEGKKAVAHYTQMVWADSVYLGCGMSKTYDGKWTRYMIVCYYGPAGNILWKAPYAPGLPKPFNRPLKCKSDCEWCNDVYGPRCWENGYVPPS